MNLEEKIIKSETVFKGNIVDFDKLTVILPNGKEATRDVITHPGASVVLPINENNEIYLVKQFRSTINQLLYEIPAGKLDPNEDPKDCAIRELKEETGLIANSVEKVLSIHSTPGFSNEVLHLFLARDLVQSSIELDEDEFLTVEKFPLDKLLDMVVTNQITDSKTIIAILYAQTLVRRD